MKANKIKVFQYKHDDDNNINDYEKITVIMYDNSLLYVCRNEEIEGELSIISTTYLINNYKQLFQDVLKEPAESLYNIQCYFSDLIEKSFEKRISQENKQDLYTIINTIENKIQNDDIKYEETVIELTKEEIENIIDIKKYMAIAKEKKLIESNYYTNHPILENKETANTTNLPVLKEHGIELTKKCYRYDPVAGRKEEIKKVIVSLFDKSTMLVGDPGVGKTVIIESIAYLIKTGQVPDYLRNKKVFKIDTSSLVSGCSYVGQLEEKVRSLLNEVSLNPDIILFIDEIHTMIGSGKGINGSLDIANIFKPYLDSENIKIIGATTKEEYDEYISKDPAFRRRFEVINILEPDNIHLKEIINTTITRLEEKTNIKFNYSIENKNIIIDSLIELTKKQNRNYWEETHNPDVSLTILKKSFSYAAYYENEEVKLENIKEAITSSDQIYESIREKIISKLERKLLEDTNKTDNDKIITFQKRR